MTSGEGRERYKWPSDRVTEGRTGLCSLWFIPSHCYSPETLLVIRNLSSLSGPALGAHPDRLARPGPANAQVCALLAQHTDLRTCVARLLHSRTSFMSVHSTKSGMTARCPSFRGQVGELDHPGRHRPASLTRCAFGCATRLSLNPPENSPVCTEGESLGGSPVRKDQGGYTMTTIRGLLNLANAEPGHREIGLCGIPGLVRTEELASMIAEGAMAKICSDDGVIRGLCLITQDRPGSFRVKLLLAAGDYREQKSIKTSLLHEAILDLGRARGEIVAELPSDDLSGRLALRSCGFEPSAVSLRHLPGGRDAAAWEELLSPLGCAWGEGVAQCSGGHGLQTRTTESPLLFRRSLAQT